MHGYVGYSDNVLNIAVLLIKREGDVEKGLLILWLSQECSRNLRVFNIDQTTVVQTSEMVYIQGIQALSIGPYMDRIIIIVDF